MNDHPFRFLFPVAVLSACLNVSPASAVEFFVSPGGSDTASGTQGAPFATISRARKAASSFAGKQDLTIFLRGGDYYLPETVVFTAADSGSVAHPVVYRAFNNETPAISGGVRLDLQWEPYKDGIMRAKVPSGFRTDQLFVNGERQQMARYPNFKPTERIFNGYAADAISPERVGRWADPAGGFIHAMHAASWGGFSWVITGKKADGTLLMEGGWQNNRPAGMHKQHRFVENIFEELDAPGEWFLNPKTETLYYYPPAGLDLAKARIEAVRLRHLFEFQGQQKTPVRFVTLKGLTFRHAARTFMENKEPLVRSDWTTYRGGAIFLNGAEDCTLEDCFIDQVGGNAVFVNNYNRRVTVRGCHIAKAGANGVAFVGDRDAARVPRDFHENQSLDTVDRTPGPKTENYPADCLVDDSLIYLSGRVEKQTAPVQIELSQGITVRHCSIYDVPRAGINIGDGCWGGHVIEFCDIFDTVKETGDHGSFNSWGRDRFWGLGKLDLNDDKQWEAHHDLPFWDAVKPNILRNSRWRCDHGWDIDLDDGSTNYHIYNTLCLHGGLKNREGFGRIVENNVILNTYHPHVWYKHSEDVVRRNIFTLDHYAPAGGMPAVWGKEMDFNLVHQSGLATKPAERLAAQSKHDAHSIVADAMFVDPDKGNYQVRDGSPALKLGFVNFPMDQFGVQNPKLKAIARTPAFPTAADLGAGNPEEKAIRAGVFCQARVRDIFGLGDRSAYGLPDESGVLVLEVPAQSNAAKGGLRKDDVILSCNGKEVHHIADLPRQEIKAGSRTLTLTVRRNQQNTPVVLTGP